MADKRKGVAPTNGKWHRMPRRMILGRDVAVAVHVVAPKVIAEMLDEDDEPSSGWAVGAWVPDENAIYISSRLNLAERWDCYRHEAIHALNDIIARTNPNPLIT